MRWLWLPLAILAAWKAIRICTAARRDHVSENVRNRLRMLDVDHGPEATGKREQEVPDLQPMTRRQTALSRAWRGEQ